MIDEKKLIEILKKREELIYPSAILEVAGGHEIYDEQSFGRYSELGIIGNIVKRLAEENNGGWIPCSERLPEDGQQVLVFYDNCLYSCMSVAKFRKGKTKEELQAMEQPCFGSADQWGNNLKPYAWFGDGPVEWFGQEIIAWQPLPESYQPPAAEPTMTNADRIRNMTDEELAKFIHAVGCNSHYGDDCGYPFCHSMEGNLCHGIKDNTDARTLKWLKSEVAKE